MRGDVAAEKGLAILITTHNMAFGYEADRVITLEDGKIVKEFVGMTDSQLEKAIAMAAVTFESWKKKLQFTHDWIFSGGRIYLDLAISR